jgi:hypothetical protein
MGCVFDLCGSPVLPCASFLSIMIPKRKTFSRSRICAVLIAIMGLVMAFGSTARAISSIVAK